MASYARQSEDDSLRKMCDRIQARAIRRCGELLSAIEPAPGARSDREPRGGGDTRLTRKGAAESAGISERQRVTALRVAKVRRTFETAVEANTRARTGALPHFATKKWVGNACVDRRAPGLLRCGFGVTSLADHLSRGLVPATVTEMSYIGTT